MCCKIVRWERREGIVGDAIEGGCICCEEKMCVEQRRGYLWRMSAVEDCGMVASAGRRRGFDL